MPIRKLLEEIETKYTLYFEQVRLNLTITLTHPAIPPVKLY